MTGSKHLSYRDVVVTATAQFQSPKYEFRFCVGKKPDCGARGLQW